MSESANKEPAEPQPTQESQPDQQAVPEGADPGSPTMDYFEKDEKPSGESR
ncbi:MAG: hypothetical protein ACRDKT_02550 [Actinomycetota bacterium]